MIVIVAPRGPSPTLVRLQARREERRGYGLLASAPFFTASRPRGPRVLVI